MLMPATSFIFLWIEGAGYWLVIEGEPLINNRAFVELIWGIKADNERPLAPVGVTDETQTPQA